MSSVLKKAVKLNHSLTDSLSLAEPIPRMILDIIYLNIRCNTKFKENMVTPELIASSTDFILHKG